MKQMFSTLTPNERVAALADNAARIEKDFPYVHTLDDDEVNARKDEFVELSGATNKLEDEFSEVRKDYSDRIKGNKQTMKQTLKTIRTRQADISGTVYIFDDQEAGMMEYYDEQGYMVYSRRMKPEEKQTNIHSIKKAI